MFWYDFCQLSRFRGKRSIYFNRYKYAFKMFVIGNTKLDQYSNTSHYSCYKSHTWNNSQTQWQLKLCLVHYIVIFSYYYCTFFRAQNVLCYCSVFIIHRQLKYVNFELFISDQSPDCTMNLITNIYQEPPKKKCFWSTAVKTFFSQGQNHLSCVLIFRCFLIFNTIMIPR